MSKKNKLIQGAGGANSFYGVMSKKKHQNQGKTANQE
jgi:hypothetical protein